MGYTHYCKATRALDRGTFAKWSGDCARIVDTFEKKTGIQLANGFGNDRPVFREDRVWFNGSATCGHSSDFLLRHTYCGGACDYETFGLELKDDGNFVKTGMRPYDIAVTACLLMLRYRFRDGVVISSDGNTKEWAAGQELCLLACDIMPPIPDTIRGANSEAR